MSEWSEQELTLREAFGLDDAQLRWRRWCISANCAGNEDIFAQEYPATPEEAFLTSGRPVFNVKALNEAYGKAEEARQGALVRRGERVEFVPDEGRYLRMYEPVITGREYMIGIDVAAGYSGGDYSAMVVLDRDSFAVAAVWHGHIEPELLAEQAEMLGRYYNRALLVPEANNHGIAVLAALKRMHYGHVWRRNNGEAGFLTTAKSKAEMIAALAAYIREDALRIRDRGIISECLSYVYDDKGHTNAQAGTHDDLVIALALGVNIAMERPRGQRIIEADWSALYGANEHTGY